MAVPKAIIITAVPKYIDSDGTLSNHVGIKLKTGNSILRCNTDATIASKMVIPKSNSITSTGCDDSQVKIPNRKRRLDHLTMEEKFQRKKLKNRVAAQTSRDRKKARLDDLEAEVKALREKNEALTLQCHNLQLEKIQLATVNQELRQKLSGLECNHQAHGVGCSTQFEPAEFSLDPLLQGQISSIILMEMCAYLTWMNWHRAYSEKPQKKWMQSADKPVQRLELMDSRERGTVIKWWGRHQKTWKPIEN